MSRIVPVSLTEFLQLVEYAQQHHATHNEPIPQVYENQYGKISSCLETPFQTFGGRLLYKGFYLKAAVLFYLLNKNHALINGNKRMACITMAYFCSKNKHELLLSPQEFYNMAKAVSQSSDEYMERDLKIIANLLRYVQK